MTLEENKELIRRYVKEIYIKKDLTNYAEYVSNEILDFGVDHLEQFFTAFPDAHVNVLDMFGEGEKVIARLDIHGTNTGSFAGQPPTGKKVNFESYRIYRIVEKKLSNLGQCKIDWVSWINWDSCNQLVVISTGDRRTKTKNPYYQEEALEPDRITGLDPQIPI